MKAEGGGRIRIGNEEREKIVNSRKSVRKIGLKWTKRRKKIKIDREGKRERKKHKNRQKKEDRIRTKEEQRI